MTAGKRPLSRTGSRSCTGASTQIPTPLTTGQTTVIPGGTSAGIAAGIQAGHKGRSVIVLKQSRHILGLTTEGHTEAEVGPPSAAAGSPTLRPLRRACTKLP